MGPGRQSTGTTEETQTSTRTPLAGAQPLQDLLYRKATDAFAATNNNPFTGKLFADPTAAQKAGVKGMIDAAPGMGTGVGDIRNYATSLIKGDWLAPGTNPFIQGVADQVGTNLRKQFDTSRGSLSDAAIAAGAYGGSRQDLQENQLMQDFMQTLGDTNNNLFFGNYNAERDRMSQAPAMFDAANLLALAGPTTQLQAGGIQQGWDQAKLDEVLAQWQQQQTAPWAGMEELMAIIGSGGFGTTTGTGTAETFRPTGTLSGALQGAMSGGLTGLQVGSKFGAPWAGIPGALAGGLIGLL